jgi:hypothetical protein
MESVLFLVFMHMIQLNELYFACPVFITLQTGYYFEEQKSAARCENME